MKPNRFEVGEIVRLKNIPTVYAQNRGLLVVVKSLPGSIPDRPQCYTVTTTKGVMAILENFAEVEALEPHNRGDTDKVVSWAEFEAATKVSASAIKQGPPKDY